MNEIKKECDELYAQIKSATDRLTEIRSTCSHERKEEANYSYRVGVYNRAIICSDCGTPLEVFDFNPFLNT